MFFLLSVWFRDPALWFDVNEGEKVTERERSEAGREVCFDRGESVCFRWEAQLCATDLS